MNPNHTIPKKLSVCIVTHHSDLDLLKQTVESLRKSQVAHQLLIIDNASADDYLKQLQQDPTLSILANQENRGFGAGHNLGFKTLPEADYHLVLNPDVSIHEHCLENMIAFMDAHSEVGLATPRILNPDQTLQYLNKRLPTVWDLFIRRFIPKPLQHIAFVRKRFQYYTMQDVGYDHPCRVPYISGCFMLFRTKTLRQIGAFDERIFMYLEDADMTKRINEVSQTTYLPNAHITHHWSRGSHRSWALTWTTICSAYYFFNKWGWKWF
ncbi:MAG: glycosyltransferase family 2 protein [Mariprofundaceae bacterium]